MKRLLSIFILMAFTLPVYAGKAGLFTGNKGYPYNVTVTSATSVTLFTNDGEIEDVQYENRTGYDIILTTFSMTATLLRPTTSYVNQRLLKDGKWPPFQMKNSNYRFAISTAGTPSAPNFFVDVNK